MDNPVRPIPELIAEIVTSTEVKRVVCVDDDFALGVSMEAVEALCLALPTEAALIEDLNGVAFDEDSEIWQEQLRKVWAGLDNPKKEAMHKRLWDKASPEQLPRVQCLKGWFLSDKCACLTMSWTEWQKKRDEILEAAKGEKTLLVVDHDLSKEGAATNEGIKIISHALGAVTGPGLVCVLLSNTFRPGEEHDLWVSFAKDNGLEKDRFMLASKDRMNEPPVGFAMMVKLALINPLCQKFRSQVTAVIKDSIDHAIKRVDEINIYELERMVFAASGTEGVWEPDTMFRLFGVYQRSEARKLAKASADLSKTSDQIRAVSGITTDSEVDRPASWKVRRLEMYEDAEYLNQHFLPTELGDVYVGKNGKKYILLIQPCDLMVRSNGSRKGSVTETIVARVVDQPPEKGEGAFRLDFFDPENGADWYVIFRDVFTVPLDVLDFCSLHPYGKCEMSEADTTPAGVIPSWRHRHTELKKKVQAAAKHYDDMLKKIKGQAPKGDLSVVSQEMTEFAIGRTFTPHPKKLFGGALDLTPKVLRFECKRIRRLCQPWSAALLTQYSQFLSRAAFEHGYGSEHYRPTV